MALLFSSRPHTVRHLLVDAAGITLVAAGVATALLPGGLDLTNTNDATLPAVQTQRQTPTDAREQALMKRFDCSTEGFGKKQIPRSSIIRRADGRAAVVSFDRGWKVFKSDSADTLVAVCLKPSG